MLDKIHDMNGCTDVGSCDGLNEGRQKIDHDDEAHGETTETAELVQEDEFTEIVHGRVNPTPTLRQQNLPIIWRHCVSMSIPDELRLEVGEVLQEKCGHVTIFSKVQKILHMQRIHTILRVVLD